MLTRLRRPTNAAGGALVFDAADPMCPVHCVVYLVDPFLSVARADQYGAPADLSYEMAICRTLLHAKLSPHLRDRVSVHVLRPHDLLHGPGPECADSGAVDGPGQPPMAQITQTALTVYASLRRTLVARSRFADASVSTARHVVDLYAPPVMLAPPPPLVSAPHSGTVDITRADEAIAVLHCAYCVADNGRYVIGVLTDASGGLLRTKALRVQRTDASHSRRGCAVDDLVIGRGALAELWQFAAAPTVCSEQHWHLVICRAGVMPAREVTGARLRGCAGADDAAVRSAY